MNKATIDKVLEETLFVGESPCLNQKQVGELFGVTAARISMLGVQNRMIDKGLITRWPKPGNWHRYAYGSAALTVLGTLMGKKTIAHTYLAKAREKAAPAEVVVPVSLKPSAELAKPSAQERQLCAIGPVKFEAIIADGEAWITQKQMAELFGVSVSAVSQHIAAIKRDVECKPETTIKEYLIVASNGYSYGTRHYSSEMVQAVGYRVKSSRGVEYRQWVTKVVRGEVEAPKLQSPKPSSAVDLFEAQVLAFREQEAKLLSIETTVSRLDQEWSEFKARGEESRAEMRKLPDPTVEVKEKTTRAAINQLVRAAAHARGVSEQEAFRKVYTEFKYRYRIDVDARRDNALKLGKKLSKLDIVEDLEMLDELYALAMHCFK